MPVTISNLYLVINKLEDISKSDNLPRQKKEALIANIEILGKLQHLESIDNLPILNYKREEYKNTILNSILV